MYDEIIEKFRKEYEKEIRSIFDPNRGGKKTVTKKWLTSIIGGGTRTGAWYCLPYPIPQEVTTINLRKKEFRNLDERFKTNVPPIIEKYLNQVYEKYETMYSQDSLLEILPELGVCNNDKIEDLKEGLNKILRIIRLEHIYITEHTLADCRYFFKRPSRLTEKYMSNSDNNLETLLLATSNPRGFEIDGRCLGTMFINLSPLRDSIYRHFERGSRLAGVPPLVLTYISYEYSPIKKYLQGTIFR